MSSSMQRGLLSTVWIYGKETWRRMESVKQILLLSSEKNSDTQKTTGESQKAIVSSTSAERISDVDFQARPENLKRTKRVRRKRSGKSNAEPATKEPAKSTTDVLNGNKSNRDAKSCKSRLTVPGEEPRKDDDFSEWHLVKKVRKPRASRSDDVLHAKDQQKNNSRNNNNKPIDALNKSGGDIVNTKSSGPLKCNTMGLKSNNGERFTAGARQRSIHTKVLSKNEIKVNEPKNARILTVATKEAAANKTGVKFETKRQYDKTEELKRSVKWILNKLTEENVVELTKNLTALPMDTIERLQTTADVIFEKVLYEQNFVHLYASLCSDIKSLRVTCDGGKSTVFFLSLILKNCQKQFKVDRAHRADGVKKLIEINSCKDHEKKKKLQMEYEVNERRSRKRSIGNCRFIGELFKKNLIKTSIMTYCIADLLEQSTESSLESLCVLLKTAGIDLEKTCKLNETLDKLKSLALKKTISLRMRYMIKSTIDLWKKL